jgi:hypothetical protein
MKFIVDAQLPPALAHRLVELGHEANTLLRLGSQPLRTRRFGGTLNMPGRPSGRCAFSWARNFQSLRRPEAYTHYSVWVLLRLVVSHRTILHSVYVVPADANPTSASDWCWGSRALPRFHTPPRDRRWCARAVGRKSESAFPRMRLAHVCQLRRSSQQNRRFRLSLQSDFLQ